MASKKRLRKLRTGTVINLTSSKQEQDIGKALLEVGRMLAERHPFEFVHKGQLFLHEIVSRLASEFPNTDFHCHSRKTFLRPDGGLLYLRGKDDRLHLILVSEVKNQGTNDVRLEEGKEEQSKGNAVERLGKNVIGFRSHMLTETILPFVCFGYGCDFEGGSYILDRISTTAMFGRLNITHLHREGPQGEFARGSFYFRPERWTVEEMAEVMFDIANRSVLYYLSKYGEYGEYGDGFVLRDAAIRRT